MTGVGGGVGVEGMHGQQAHDDRAGDCDEQQEGASHGAAGVDPVRQCDQRHVTSLPYTLRQTGQRRMTASGLRSNRRSS